MLKKKRLTFDHNFLVEEGTFNNFMDDWFKNVFAKECDLKAF